MMNAKIIAVGGYLPQNKVSNFDLSQKVNTSDEWITSRTGIKFRYIAADGEYTSDLAVSALKDALNKSNIDPKTLDGIIVATVTPDLVFPSTACLVQKKIGILNGFAFDINAVCSGFVYALSVASSMIASGAAKRIAVIGADTMSRIIDWDDRSTCVLFGDGAGAVILEATPDKTQGILGFNIHSNGCYDDILKVPGGTSSGNLSAKVLMNGREVYRHAMDKFVSSSADLLMLNNCSLAEIDWYIPHQANKRIIESVAEKIGIDLDKVVITVDIHANTSAASIPLALNHYIDQNMIKSGQLLVMSAFGAGLTWGAALVRF